jgi:hypothetical protein
MGVVRGCQTILRGRGRATLLGTTVRVDHASCPPFSPSGGRDGANHRHRDRELGPKVDGVVRISHHHEILGHVDSGDDDRLDVIAVSSLAGEPDPGIVMAFRVCFKGGF